jgi:aminoglycoside phosphotransferase (APT) family kinase protein
MYQHGAPARLAAIVDWEMGTVGDPKLDLGWVLQMWPDDTTAAVDVPIGAAYADITGMPGKAELLDYFRGETGRQVDDIDYYLILARWKLGIVLEQGYMRVMRGQGDEKQKAFGPLVLDLIKRAADLAETTDYA